MKFIDKMFDIILENLMNQKYKFKLHHCEEPITVDFNEIKKIAKMTKYQKNELLRERRISEKEMFMAEMDPNAKLYNYFTVFSRNQYIEIKNKLQKAVENINDGRNKIMEALTQLDALNFVSSKANLFNGVTSQKAAQYYIERKLGENYSPELMFKYKKKARKVEYAIDPRLITSSRTSIPTKPPEVIIYKTEVMYHEHKQDLKFV